MSDHSAGASSLRQAFDYFDEDGNGQIDLAEFCALLKRLEVWRHESIARLAFSAIDLDGNGFVDFGEFAAWWNSGGALDLRDVTGPPVS